MPQLIPFIVIYLACDTKPLAAAAKAAGVRIRCKMPGLISAPELDAKAVYAPHHPDIVAAYAEHGIPALDELPFDYDAPETTETTDTEPPADTQPPADATTDEAPTTAPSEPVGDVTPDNLQDLHGLGPASEKALHAMDIHTFLQLADAIQDPAIAPRLEGLHGVTRDDLKAWLIAIQAQQQGNA